MFPRPQCPVRSATADRSLIHAELASRFYQPSVRLSARTHIASSSEPRPMLQEICPVLHHSRPRRTQQRSAGTCRGHQLLLAPRIPGPYWILRDQNPAFLRMFGGSGRTWKYRIGRWRRDRDSNPGYLAVYTLSKRAPSATRPSLRAGVGLVESSIFAGVAGLSGSGHGSCTSIVWRTVARRTGARGTPLRRYRWSVAGSRQFRLHPFWIARRIYGPGTTRGSRKLPSESL